jgi:hypothetical protein
VPVSAGQRKLSSDVLDMIDQRVERAMLLKQGPLMASPKLSGIEAITHELLVAVLEALEECTEDAIADGEPAPNVRDKCRAFAWALADIMGATLPCPNSARTQHCLPCHSRQVMLRLEPSTASHATIAR